MKKVCWICWRGESGYYVKLQQAALSWEECQIIWLKCSSFKKFYMLMIAQDMDEFGQRLKWVVLVLYINDTSSVTNVFSRKKRLSLIPTGKNVLFKDNQEKWNIQLHTLHSIFLCLTFKKIYFISRCTVSSWVVFKFKC